MKAFVGAESSLWFYDCSLLLQLCFNPASVILGVDCPVLVKTQVLEISGTSEIYGCTCTDILVTYLLPFGQEALPLLTWRSCNIWSQSSLPEEWGLGEVQSRTLEATAA